MNAKQPTIIVTNLESFLDYESEQHWIDLEFCAGDITIKVDSVQISEQDKDRILEASRKLRKIM